MQCLKSYSNGDGNTFSDSLHRGMAPLATISFHCSVTDRKVVHTLKVMKYDKNQEMIYSFNKIFHNSIQCDISFKTALPTFN